MKIPPRVLVFLSCLIISTITFGQSKFKPPVKTSFDLLDLHVDTMKIDTITSGSHLYNPQYATFPTWHELGNLGFSALPTKWNGISRLNEPHYLKSFRHYTNPENKLIQYQTNKPYALLNYTSGGSKDVNGQLIRAVFARPLVPGVRFTALLDFINSPGLYKNQSGSQSSFTINIEVDKRRYDLKAGVEILKFILGENGGVRNPGDIIEYVPGDTPISLGDAVSGTSWTIIQGRQEFDLFAKAKVDSIPALDTIAFPIQLDSIAVDSIPSDSLAFETLSNLLPDSVITELETPKPKLFHLFNYQLSERLYGDKQKLSGTYYSDNLISGDEAVDSMRFRTFDNKIGFSHSGVFGDSINWFAQIGAYHVLSSWTSNELSGSFQQFGAFGDARFENMVWLALLKSKIQLLGYGIGSYDVDFLVARKDQSDGWDLSMGVRSQMEQPAIFYQVFSGNHDRWFGSFKNQLEQGVRLNAKHNGWRLSAGANINMISNWVYFDTLAIPNQAESTSLLGSVYIKKSFKAGPFRSENMLLTQYTAAKEIPLPLIVASSSTYMHHDILFPKTSGKLEIEYGFDVRFCTSYQGYAFRPSSGAFFLQNQQMMGNYPYIDPFFTARVKRTRVFIKWEHVNAGLMGYNFFPVLNYPVKERFIKYGVYWHFYD